MELMFEFRSGLRSRGAHYVTGFRDTECRPILEIRPIIAAQGGPTIITMSPPTPAHCRAGNVLVRDWGECRGIMRSLIDAGVLGEPIGHREVGVRVAHECPLLRNDIIREAAA